MGYCFFEMWPRLPWRHRHLKKGNFTTRKSFSWTFSLIFSLGFTPSSDTTVNSICTLHLSPHQKTMTMFHACHRSSVSFTMCLAKNGYKEHLLSCATSFQITCNMKRRMDFQLTIGKVACGEYLTSGLVGFGCFEKSSRLGLRQLAIQNLG